MKKIAILFKLMFVLSVPMIVSCEDNDSIDNPQFSEVPNIKTDLYIISSLGFDTAGIVMTDSCYVIEGDIAIRKSVIQEYLNNDLKVATTRKAYISLLVNNTYVGNIKFKIDASLYNTSNWKDAILQAASEYNNIGSSIHFVEVSSNYDVLIKEDTSLAPSTLGQGTWPSNGRAGNLVKINTNYNYLSLSQKIFLLVHELGHNLGLRHTNWSGLSESTGIGVPGTPNSGTNPDPSSVMNGNVGGNSWTGFSNYDTVAIRVLYNACYIFGPDDICDTSEQTFTLINVPPGASVTWSHTGYNHESYLSPSSFTGNPYIVRNISDTDKLIVLSATVTLPDGYSYNTTNRNIYLYNHYNPGPYFETLDNTDFSLRNYEDSKAHDFQWEVSDGVVYMQGRSYTLIDFASGVGAYTVKCHYTNGCGERITIVKFITL
ncbi:M57 family metalloprotease [Bacteroides sp.]|uniref:M57 family metalloprotease n=1 Tax=Bacteroides sp. TaxID=29523 RepID=UPI002602BC7A|nr:M57 family metalloprotease [Bacteroides sp.]